MTNGDVGVWVSFGSGLDVEHGVGTEAQIFQSAALVGFVGPPREVAHKFILPFGHLAHPTVYLFYSALFL